MGSSRRPWLLGLLLLAACTPKVDPRSPFDEDDPRALPVEGEAAPAPSPSPAAEPPEASGPIAIPGTGARTGELSREDLRPLLDAGPSEFLRRFEVEAAATAGKFVGWRLVRFLPSGRSLTALDLVPGDILISINGRPLIKPADLATLWSELYAAEAIVAVMNRSGAAFELRFAITGPAIASPNRGPAAAP